jgi:hypothetical protein
MQTGFISQRRVDQKKKKAIATNGRGVKDSLTECSGFRNKSFEFKSDIYFARNNGCPGIFSLA